MELKDMLFIVRTAPNSEFRIFVCTRSLLPTEVLLAALRKARFSITVKKNFELPYHLRGTSMMCADTKMVQRYTPSTQLQNYCFYFEINYLNKTLIVSPCR